MKFLIKLDCRLRGNDEIAGLITDESRKFLMTLDCRLRGNDEIAGLIRFCKDLVK